jgi:hypothetical protein
VDLVFAIVAGILMVAGIIGCLLPFLPGPPLSYAGLLLLQLQSESPFTTSFLIIWAFITIVVTVADYLVPVWGTKKWGGSKFGVWGCVLGLFGGFWFGPPGIILGPFVGALVGEMIHTQNSDIAFRAAIGSFFGFMLGTLLKLIVSSIMLYYYIISL